MIHMMTRLLVLLTMAVSLLMSPALATAPASASVQEETACRVISYTPYKHVRITGQKQVYGSGWFDCTGGRSALGIEVRLNKWNSSDQLWYVHGRTVSGGSLSVTVRAYEWLCNNYGFGASGTGYYATETRGRYYDHATQKSWYTAWKRSSHAYLTC